MYSIAIVPISLSVASSLSNGFHFRNLVTNSTTSSVFTNKCAAFVNVSRLQEPSPCWLARMFFSSAGVFVILGEDEEIFIDILGLEENGAVGGKVRG